MKQRPGRLHRPNLPKPCLALALAAVTGMALGACLPNDPPVQGQLLYPGSNVESPVFLALGEHEPWVLFHTRRTLATSVLGGTTDLHLVHWPDGKDHRVVLEGRSDRAEWSTVQDASGAYFYMTNEQPPENGLPRATLNRVSLTEGIKESLPDVMGYALSASRKTFYYRKYVEGSRYADLHLRALDGRDRNLGPLSGQVIMLGDDGFFFIAAPMQTLTRVKGFDEEPVVLRTRVNRFQLGGEQKFAIATVADEGVLKTVVLDFVNNTERPLPVANPCCWLELRDTTFTFSDSATPDKPATIHYFNVMTGADRVVEVPAGLVNVTSVMPRSADESLLFDSTRRAAIYRPMDDPPIRVTDLRPSAPNFSKDGRYLLYLVPEPPPPPPAISSSVTGQLWAQDADHWEIPPRLLSPVGASVPVEPQPGYLVRDGKPFPLVFWARYGLGASDLYLGDHETGISVRIAQGIGEVSVSQTRVLGVVHMSQDLTGDLVYRDFAQDKQKVIEHGVADVAFDGNLFPDDLIAFIVHERMPSSPRNGLWSTMLPSLDDLDAGTAVLARTSGGAVDAGGAGEEPNPSVSPRNR